jgi:hypothetical protein
MTKIPREVRAPLNICDHRWLTTDFNGERWWHSCDRDRGHRPRYRQSRRHFCSCDASITEQEQAERLGFKKLASLAPLPPSPDPRFPEKSPERSFDQYLAKCGGVPDAGSGSDEAVFRAALWAEHNLPELSEDAFINGIRRYQPGFDERWIGQKWKSANRGR